MADLKSLFAKKDSNAEPSPSVARTPDATPAESGTQPAAAPATEQPADTKPKRPVFGVNRGSDANPGGSPATSGESAGGSEQPKPGLSALRLPTGARDSDSPASAVAAPALDSLDALNTSEDEGVAPRGERVAYFADETPAVKPTRDLPADITKEQLGFVDMIDGIYEIIHDPDLLGGVIRNIMVELKSNAEYTKLMAPEDFRTMVRGMRESMGLARVKKQESKAKKSAPRKSKALDDDVLAGLDDILGDIS